MTKRIISDIRRVDLRCHFLSFVSLLAASLFFAPLPVVASANNNVTVVVGGKPVTFVVSPYLAGDGQVYMPVDVVHLMGGDYTPAADGKSVTITTATGATVSSPFQFVNSRFCVPLLRYVDALGASASWDVKNRTLTFRAKLQMVRADDGGLTITTTYPVAYSVNKLDREQKGDPPRRVYVDLYGVDLGAPPATIPSTESNVLFIKTGRLDDDTARVVVALRKPLPFDIRSAPTTNQVQVALAGLNDRPVHPVVAAVPPPVSPAPPERSTTTDDTAAAGPPSVGPLPVNPVQVAGQPPDQSGGAQTPLDSQPSPGPGIVQTAGQGLQITGVSYKVVSPTLTEIEVAVNEPAKYRWLALNDPTSRLAFDVAGAGFADTLGKGLNINSPVVKAIRTGTVATANGSFGRVVMDLSHAVDFSVTSAPSDTGVVYTISLITPDVAEETSSNALHGLVVMVDPGHGADDDGAISPDHRYFEKNIALAIGRDLREVLARNGATVYMTREDDVKPAVGERPKMAIAAGANYFISVHCDDDDVRNSHSGTTVYYHGHNDLTRKMAIDIVNRVAAVSGLPANGVKTDFNRFPGLGFGVLRGLPQTGIPGVLVECGFMNNDHDLPKLIDPDAQRRIAQGITAGLMDFVAERSAR